MFGSTPGLHYVYVPYFSGMPIPFHLGAPGMFTSTAGTFYSKCI